MELIVSCIYVENNLPGWLPVRIVCEKMIDKESCYPSFIVDDLLVTVLGRNTSTGGLKAIQCAFPRKRLAAVFASQPSIPFHIRLIA